DHAPPPPQDGQLLPDGFEPRHGKFIIFRVNHSPSIKATRTPNASQLFHSGRTMLERTTLVVSFRSSGNWETDSREYILPPDTVAISCSRLTLRTAVRRSADKAAT